MTDELTEKAERDLLSAENDRLVNLVSAADDARDAYKAERDEAVGQRDKMVTRALALQARIDAALSLDYATENYLEACRAELTGEATT